MTEKSELGAQEVVAFQKRPKFGEHRIWSSMYHDDAEFWRGQDYEIRPLYAAPPPSGERLTSDAGETIIGGTNFCGHGVMASICKQCAPAPSEAAPVQALKDIAAERKRQIVQEGWTSEHDDSHVDGSMAIAAAVYALHPFRWHLVISERSGQRLLALKDFWPWDIKWFKPKDRRRNLIKSAALIVAEIERLDRVSVTQATGGETER